MDIYHPDMQRWADLMRQQDGDKASTDGQSAQADTQQSNAAAIQAARLSGA